MTFSFISLINKLHWANSVCGEVRETISVLERARQIPDICFVNSRMAVWVVDPAWFDIAAGRGPYLYPAACNENSLA